MKSYGQYCGLARAAELVGERWSLVILRDLLVGPKRFNELRQGIPGIPSNLLTSRLRDFEDASVVERVLDGRNVVYRLSEYGQGLEPIVVGLGRWGARQMDVPRENEVPTDNSLAAALLTARTDEKVQAFSVEVTAGPATAHADVSATAVSVVAGPFPDADLRLGGSGLRRLLADGDIDAAISSGAVTAKGPATLLKEFTRAFSTPLDEVAHNLP